MSSGQRDLLRNVLSGWHQWTPSEWEAMSSNGTDSVANALAAWDAAVDD